MVIQLIKKYCIGGLNISIDAYDDEYSDVYDLEEGGKTENIVGLDENISLDEALSDEKDAEQNVTAIEDVFMDDAIEEQDETETVEDSDIIAAKAASILSGDEFEDEDEDEDFIERLQKKLESNRSIVTPIRKEDIENRMRMVQPESIPVLEEDEGMDEEADEIVSSDMDHTIMNMFQNEIDFALKPADLMTLDDDDDGEEDTDEADETSENKLETESEVDDKAIEDELTKDEAVHDQSFEESVQADVVKDTVKTLYADDEDEIVTDDIPVPDTVLDIFATAVDIRDVKKQLAETFTKLESSLLDKEDILAPYDINFVVSGTDESMKSQISIGIAKALNTYGVCDKTKMVRATAEELNAMDFSVVFEKIAGGCLIISGAGALSEASIEIITDYVNQDGQKVAIVLEDSEKDFMNLWKKYPKLRSKFLNVINISKYDSSELVKLAESYAKRRGYDISDEVRNIVLKAIFEERMSSGEDVNYEDVMAIIDEAVVNLEKRNMKNLFMTVLDNAYTEASMFTLISEDFD